MSLKVKIYRSFNLALAEVDSLADLLPGESVVAHLLDEQDAINDYERQFLVKFTYNSNAVEGGGRCESQAWNEDRCRESRGEIGSSFAEYERRIWAGC